MSDKFINYLKSKFNLDPSWTKTNVGKWLENNLMPIHEENYKSFEDFSLNETDEKFKGSWKDNNWRRVLNKKRIASMVPLLSRAIKTIDLNKSEYKARILGTPWVRLPNIADFKINISGPDLLFKYFGLKKNLPPILEVQKFKSNSMNRYLEHQVIRLIKSKSNPKLYWALSRILMKRSNVWRVMSIHTMIPKWHRDYPLHLIVNLNRKLSKLINSDESKLDFTRVYIPKGEKGWRPLGVPSLEWRLYLHMYNRFLTFFLQDHIHPNQHAFIPGKGTLTAWKQIFEEKLYDYKWIQEWDFKQFFPSLHCNRITEELLKLNMPKKEVYFLENINRSTPKLPDDKKLDESHAEQQKESHESIYQGHMFEGLLKTYYELIRDSRVMYHVWGWDVYDRIKKDFDARTVGDANRELIETFMQEDGYDNIFEYIQAQWAALDHYRPAKIDTDFNGVAQGAATSPILANLIMNLWLKQQNSEGQTCIAYADDSITFSNTPIKLNDPKNQAPSDTGIEIHEEKSLSIKRNDVWSGAIKFLGLKFDGKVFQANTRKGSKLMFDKKIGELLKAEEVRVTNGLNFSSIEDVLNFMEKEEIKKKSSSEIGSSWQKMFSSKLSGFIQARMYGGEWNMENIEQDFNYTFIHNSWSHHFHQPNFTVFNSSSFAIHSLYNIFRWNSQPKKRFNRKPRTILFTRNGNPVWNTRTNQKLEKKLSLLLTLKGL